MSILKPFKALIPSQEKVSQIAAVPYDVVTTVEARALIQKNPLSFLHVSRPEINFRTGMSPYSEQAYQSAADEFERLIQDSPLTPTSEPALFLYELRMGQQIQTGIVGCFSIDEYDGDSIKKHEKTRPDKEDDRTRHILELEAQTGPVFLTFKDVSEINHLIEETKKGKSPHFKFTAVDGVEHTIWDLPTENMVATFKEQVKCLYIADGHHRAAAASRARKTLQAKNSNHTGAESYNYFLAVAFPASQLKVLPYHRVVKDLNKLTQEEFLEQIQAQFKIAEGNAELPSQGVIGMYLDHKWYRLTPHTAPQGKIDGGKTLDVELLQDVILSPILGIQDPRKDQRIDFIGGIRGTAELEKLVNTEKAKVAFSLHATDLQDVMDVSDRGGIMPPKSTWFEPKLRDGIFCHSIRMR